MGPTDYFIFVYTSQQLKQLNPKSPPMVFIFSSFLLISPICLGKEKVKALDEL
ncbi:unnamed protein product [Lupinus luteus]|uniref:Uncharacterized protein n=1 Tax=Lupinus luteus TaxID=3873 RepID=A0AAV1YMZ9_LUPLU